jgi:nicotinate-nucleotide adenylyltransferase
LCVLRNRLTQYAIPNTQYEIMKIGILGGAFNPPHLGHLILAQEAYERLDLDKVLFIPTYVSPHKQDSDISPQARMAMVRLAIAGNEIFEVSDIEIKRKGVSYTIDTLRQLKQIDESWQLYLIIGSDLANDFSKWKDFELIQKLVTRIVAERREFPLERDNGFTHLNMTPVGISSSEIRNYVREGRSIRYLVRDNVGEYIKQHKLYLGGRDD